MAAKPTPATGADIIPLRRPQLARPAPELSDEALLASCGVGDPAALGALFDRHHEAVYRLISRLLRAEPTETDDLVQLTFLGAWQSARGYKGKGSVKSFLFGIAANTVRRHFRATRRRLDALADPPPAPSPGTPEDAAVTAQHLRRLAAALDELPHDLRAAYVLCDLEDLPGAEAARILDVREGTLWRRLHDARRALREAIEGGSS
ncbi:MAG: RNA polymerase sigma factor [Myxococcales bacterium]|nr:RNA polymerase sigma factor [Myxococcales bacterium]